MSIWLFLPLGILFLIPLWILVFWTLISRKQMRDVSRFVSQGKFEDAWRKAVYITIAKTRSLAMVAVAEAASRAGALDSLRCISQDIDPNDENIRAESFIVLSAFSQNQDDLQAALESYKITRGFGAVAEYQYDMIDWLKSLVESDNPWPELKEACAKFQAV